MTYYNFEIKFFFILPLYSTKKNKENNKSDLWKNDRTFEKKQMTNRRFTSYYTFQLCRTNYSYLLFRTKPMRIDHRDWFLQS